MPNQPRPHHHGNLRQALIDAGLALLSEGQPLTLRAAALRASVSHAAPAHHFNGLAGLLTAIATQAFIAFADHMLAARDALPATSSPTDQLRAICQGYLDFFRENNKLFDLMFGPCALDRSDPALREASLFSYEILRAGCAPFAASPDEATTIELAVWSMVHGYAALNCHPSARLDPAALQRHLPDFAQLLDRLLPHNNLQ